MNKVLVICGPTATGKTALAANLARTFNGELISADSRQVYRGMDLVTGKDRPTSPAGGPDVPIWLYDVVNPDEDFSVSHWVPLASDAIVDIHKRNKLPIVVGGTGLYIRALLQPLDTIDIPPNKALRKLLATVSVAELQKMVGRGDMNDSDWQNPRRLIRRIEISRAQATVKQKGEYDACMVGLTAPLAALDARIDGRLQARTDAGMDAEARALLTIYDRNLPAMSAIGLNEHAYARRQLTWLKKQKDIRWFDITDPHYIDEIVSVVRAWYN